MTVLDDPRYDTDRVSARDRMQCFMQGHDVHSWGTLFGWCHRCMHSVHNYGARRKVLYRGEYHAYPPPHPPMAEKRARIEREVEEKMRLWGLRP